MRTNQEGFYTCMECKEKAKKMHDLKLYEKDLTCRLKIYNDDNNNNNNSSSSSESSNETDLVSSSVCYLFAIFLYLRKKWENIL
jgi:hypothetical protein